MPPPGKGKDSAKPTRTEKERQERLDMVVRAATAWWYPGVEMRAPILCVRPWRRGRRTCFKRLHLLIEGDDGPIRYVCEGCGHVGRIENWRGTDLDLSDIVVPGDGSWIEVVLTGSAVRALMRVCASSPQAVRVLAAAFAVDTDAVVAGPRSVLHEIQVLLGKAIKKTRSDNRKTFYKYTWQRIDWTLAKAT